MLRDEGLSTEVREAIDYVDNYNREKNRRVLLTDEAYHRLAIERAEANECYRQYLCDMCRAPSTSPFVRLKTICGEVTVQLSPKAGEDKKFTTIADDTIVKTHHHLVPGSRGIMVRAEVLGGSERKVEVKYFPIARSHGLVVTELDPMHPFIQYLPSSTPWYKATYDERDLRDLPAYLTDPFGVSLPVRQYKETRQ